MILHTLQHVNITTHKHTIFVCSRIQVFINLKPMWANSANKFFDALAAGKPVAINYGGWQAALLQESGAGIILPPDDPEEALRRLNTFVQDSNRIQRAGAAARCLADAHSNRDTLADKLEQVLLEAIGEKR